MTAFHVFLLLDGGAAEGAERSEHRATDPGGVLSVQSSLNINIGLCAILSKLANFCVKSIRESSHERGTASKHDVIVEINFQVAVALLNRVEGNLRNTIFVGLVRVTLWVEKDLRGKDALSLVDLNDLAGGQLVLALLLVEAVFSGVDFLVDFVSDMAHLLLHFANLENVLLLNSWRVLLDLFH